MESLMDEVQIEQKSYEMPPRDGFTVTHFITVADIDRSTDFYEKVFGGRVMSRGDSKGASGHIQIANTWLIVTVGAVPPRSREQPSVRADRFPHFLMCIVGSASAHFGEKGVYRQRDAEQHNFGLLAVRLECVVTDSDRECTSLFTPVTLI